MSQVVFQLVILELIDFKYAWNVSDIHSTWLISETVSMYIIFKMNYKLEPLEFLVAYTEAYNICS